MYLYKNLNRNSGVFNYEIGLDRIVVQFRNGHVYIYTNNATGSINIERMKILATQGSGLGTFINMYVKKKYARRLR